MTLDKAIEFMEIRKELVCSYCEDCWSEDAEIALRCMYIIRDIQAYGAEINFDLEGK